MAVNNAKVRILLLRPKLNVYGVSKILFQLACELRRRGHSVIFASHNNDNYKTRMKEAGIKYYTLPLQPGRINLFNILVSLFKIALIIRKENINLIHSHHRLSSFVSFFISKFLIYHSLQLTMEFIREKGGLLSGETLS